MSENAIFPKKTEFFTQKIIRVLHNARIFDFDTRSQLFVYNVPYPSASTRSKITTFFLKKNSIDIKYFPGKLIVNANCADNFSKFHFNAIALPDFPWYIEIKIPFFGTRTRDTDWLKHHLLAHSVNRRSYSYWPCAQLSWVIVDFDHWIHR